MPPRLLFADAANAADAVTFAQRSARLGDGWVRVRAESGVLGMTSAPLTPAHLLDETPTILGMRFLRVDPELVCDLVVEASSLTTATDDATSVILPESAQSAPWAGISPPRSGWIDEGRIPAATLASRAQWGIAAVAQAVPTDAGEDAVRAVRADIWGRGDAELAGLPLGIAFTAFALGFIAGEEAAIVRRAGPWVRVSLTRGHVLCRSTVRSGLTEVRTTGAR